MADPTVRSLASSNNSTANPRTVDKPAGLAVGDMLVMVACSFMGTSSGAPSGFSAVSSLYQNYMAVQVWTKIATSDDASASSFSVPNADEKNIGLVLYAVQGGATVEWHGEVTSPSSVTVSVAGFDPVAADDLLIGVVAAAGANPSGWAVASTSWAEDWHDFSFAAYRAWHATYPLDSATGDFSCSASSGGLGWTAAVIAIAGGDAPAATPDLFLDGVWG